MNHEALREAVVDLALGLLEPRQAREVEAHLAGCPACAAELASLRETRSAMTALPPLPAPERGEAILMAAARQAAEAAADRRPRLPRWFWGAAIGAATAAAALLVTVRLGQAPSSSFQDRADVEESFVRAPATAPVGAPPASAANARPSRPAPGAGPVAKVSPPPPPPRAAAPLAEAAVDAPPERASEPTLEFKLEGSGAGVARREEREAVGSERALPPPAGGALAAAPPAVAPPDLKRRDATAAFEDRAAPATSEGAPPPSAAKGAAARLRPEALAPAVQGELEGPPDCPRERWRALTRDAAGRVVRRERAGRLAGVDYAVDERFGPGGRLSSAVLRLGARELVLDGATLVGDGLEPIRGLRLAATAAEAEGPAPACPP
jgi:anti-sigma factor RsiW